MTARTNSRGYTLIELMVAVTISLIILAGLVTLFARNSAERAEIERANQQSDNGRYAIEILAGDLRSAGYLGDFNPLVLATPATDPDPCATDLASLKAAIPVAVQGYDDGAGLAATSCAGYLSDLKAGTDVLVVRRASTCAVGDANCDPYESGAPYFQSSGCANAAELGSGNPATYFVLDTDPAALTLHQKDCATQAPYYRYRTHVYFVANDDHAGDGIPTLKRLELGAGTFTVVPLVEGIENLQIEYGIDGTPATGSPAFYTADPDTYGGCAPAVCAGYWRNTVAAKIHVLARNTTATPAYADQKAYTLGLAADGTTPVTVGPFGDGFKRHEYDSAVRLNNAAGRNTP